jgi:hypothetical protein
MAALNFPTSPTPNQVYTANGKSWKWDGTSWKTFNTLSITGGGTGLTSITAGNAFLSSNSAGTALTYRSLSAGTGLTLSITANNVEFSAISTGFVTGTGTSAYVPIWNSSGTGLTDSIINQFQSTVIVAGQIKAITKSFKIDHPLSPHDMYLEHGSLEGPEHGIYQRGTASGYSQVTVNLPDYFSALSEKDYSILLTPRVNSQLYISSSDSESFTVRRIGRNFFSKGYIEFDYLVIGERKDIKLDVEQIK